MVVGGAALEAAVALLSTTVVAPAARKKTDKKKQSQNERQKRDRRFVSGAEKKKTTKQSRTAIAEDAHFVIETSAASLDAARQTLQAVLRTARNDVARLLVRHVRLSRAALDGHHHGLVARGQLVAALRGSTEETSRHLCPLAERQEKTNKNKRRRTMSVGSGSTSIEAPPGCGWCELNHRLQPERQPVVTTTVAGSLGGAGVVVGVVGVGGVVVVIVVVVVVVVVGLILTQGCP